MVGRGVGLAVLLAMPLSSSLAEPVDPTPPFIAELQNAIRNDDRTWLADYLHLPVHYFGKTTKVIRSKDWLLKHYATVIGPELKAKVLKQDPRRLFQELSGRDGRRRRAQHLARQFRR